MTILDEDTYRRITFDTVAYTAGVMDAALADGQMQVESFLRRPVESLERTEPLRIMEHRFLDSDRHRYYDPTIDLYGGQPVVYPEATPVIAVPTGYTILTPSAVIVGSDWNGYLTYTGGWDLDTVPYPVMVALAWAAFELLARLGATGQGELVDPEGNVIPVVPPFKPESPTIMGELLRYRKVSGSS